jgi:hypothetical protein
LKNGAGGVHEQLWQKMPVETNREINEHLDSLLLPLNRSLGDISCGDSRPRLSVRAQARQFFARSSTTRVDYPGNVGENDAALPFDPE